MQKPSRYSTVAPEVSPRSISHGGGLPGAPPVPRSDDYFFRREWSLDAPRKLQVLNNEEGVMRPWVGVAIVLRFLHAALSLERRPPPPDAPSSSPAALVPLEG